MWKTCVHSPQTVGGDEWEEMKGESGGEEEESEEREERKGKRGKELVRCQQKWNRNIFLNRVGRVVDRLLGD